MHLTDTVVDVLSRKGGEVWTIEPDASVYDALEIMAQKEIGALLVISDSVLIGLLSERDYARKVILKGKSSKETPVREIMTSPPVTIPGTTHVSECLSIMTERRIRHLPVVENGYFLGVVSIGDMVNWIISRQEQEIEHLHHYIAGGYPR
jgi:CBS domain-containing protein